MFFLSLTKAVSSAYLTICLLLKELTQEFVCKINNNGDKTHPWGAPTEVIILSEIDPPILTCLILKLRKLVTQASVLLSNKNVFAKIATNILGEIQLKAEEESIYYDITEERQRFLSVNMRVPKCNRTQLNRFGNNLF